MRNRVATGALAVSALCAALIAAERADALAFAGRGLRPAMESVDLVGAVACSHHGRYASSPHCTHAVRHAVAPAAPVDVTGAANRQRYFSRW